MRNNLSTRAGIRAKDKIKAILQMPRPENVKDVQRFLGMVNYLGSYIENLSLRNRNLRELLKGEVQWHWSSVHDAEFEERDYGDTDTDIF